MNYIIGIDLGATYAKIGIVGNDGTIIARSIIASNDTDDYLVFIENAATATDRLLADNNIDRKQIEGIGVGAPNSNFFEGTIEYAHNIRWGHDKIVPFTDILGKKMNISCLITKDANAAAMGEAKFGIAKGMKNFVPRPTYIATQAQSRRYNGKNHSRTSPLRRQGLYRDTRRDRQTAR